jgi:hypothetical protein
MPEDTYYYLLTELPVAVVLDAVASADDVGVFLRSHHLVEEIAQELCERVYQNYDALGHDTLSKHLNALKAVGNEGPVFDAARAIAKHRRDFAHTRKFEIADDHVRGVESQLLRSKGWSREKLDRAGFPSADGALKPYSLLRAAQKYLMCAMIVAGSLSVLERAASRSTASTTAS